MTSHETKLFTKIKKGDVAAFKQLFHEYYPRLVLLAKRYLGRKDLSEEMVQEVFLNIWEKKETLHVENLSSYLYRATVNECLKYIRHQKVVGEHVRKTSDLPPDQPNLPEEIYFSKEIEKITGNTLARLSETDRQIFLLNRQEGLTYKEIADKLNISVKTVEAHMSSVLKIFRQVLKEYRG